MADATYPIRVLKHKFADTIVNKTGRSMIAAALLGGLGGIGGIYALVDETPDNITNEYSADVYADFQGDLAALQENYQSVQELDDKISSGYFPNSSLAEVQQDRYRVLNDFRENAGTVIDEILGNESLSETQAEDLMSVFSETMLPAEHIRSYADIKDYGYLREARDAAASKATSVEQAARLTAQYVHAENKDKEMSALGVLGVILLLFPMIAADSSTFRRLSRERPEKKHKPKH